MQIRARARARVRVCVRTRTLVRARARPRVRVRRRHHPSWAQPRFEERRSFLFRLLVVSKTDNFVVLFAQQLQRANAEDAAAVTFTTKCVGREGG